MTAIIDVAVGVVQDNQDRFLITQRPMHQSHGGFWEFPGGKLEAGETAEQALIRELAEEVAIEVRGCDPLGSFIHAYDQSTVHLHIFRVRNFTGEAICGEGQDNLAWVSYQDLIQYQFPAANYKILAMLTEPRA